MARRPKKPALDTFTASKHARIRKRASRTIGILFDVDDDFAFAPGRGTFNQVFARYLGIWLMHYGGEMGVEEIAEELDLNRSTVADALDGMEQIAGRERNLDNVSPEEIEIEADEDIWDCAFDEALDLFHRTHRFAGFFQIGLETTREEDSRPDRQEPVRGWKGSAFMRAFNIVGRLLSAPETPKPEIPDILKPVHRLIRSLTLDPAIRKILGPMVAADAGSACDACTYAEAHEPLRGTKPELRIVTGRGKMILEQAVEPIKRALISAGFIGVTFGVMQDRKASPYFSGAEGEKPLTRWAAKFVISPVAA